MILTLTGLHGSGKSHFSSFVAKEFRWEICVKRDLLKQLYDREKNYELDWVSWYRTLYAREGPYEVTKKILDFIPSGNHLVLDSVHNWAEWRAIKERYSNAILAAIIAPRAVRAARNGPGDETLDAQRVHLWHNDGACLITESEWCFNGAASAEVQKIEFEAFLNHYAIL